jgi:hypothetical protein
MFSAAIFRSRPMSSHAFVLSWRVGARMPSPRRERSIFEARRKTPGNKPPIKLTDDPEVWVQ